MPPNPTFHSMILQHLVVIEGLDQSCQTFSVVYVNHSITNTINPSTIAGRVYLDDAAVAPSLALQETGVAAAPACRLQRLHLTQVPGSGC